MTLAQLPGYFTAAWFIERLGRKFVLVTYLIGTACSAYLFGVADSLTVLIVAGMLLSFFNLGAWEHYTPIHLSSIQRLFVVQVQEWQQHLVVSVVSLGHY